MAEGRHHRADCDEDHDDEETCLPSAEWYEDPQNQFESPWFGMYQTGFGFTDPGFARLENRIKEAARSIILTEATLERNVITLEHVKAFMELFPCFKRAPMKWGCFAAVNLMLRYVESDYRERRKNRMSKSTANGRKRYKIIHVPEMPRINTWGMGGDIIETARRPGITSQNHREHQLDPPKQSPTSTTTTRPQLSTQPAKASFPIETGSPTVNPPPSEGSSLVAVNEQQDMTRSSRAVQDIVKRDRSESDITDLPPQHRDLQIEDGAMETKKHFVVSRRHRKTYIKFESVSHHGELSWELLYSEISAIFGTVFHELGLLDGREQRRHRYSHFAASQITLSSVMELEPLRSAHSIHLAPISLSGELLDDCGNIKV